MKTQTAPTDEIRAKIIDMMRVRAVSQRQVAIGAGISITTMNQFYQGKAILTSKATRILHYLRSVPVARKSAAGGEDQ